MRVARRRPRPGPDRGRRRPRGRARPSAPAPRPRAVDPRRSQVPARLRALRLRESAGAEGRQRHAGRHRDVRQPQPVHPQGRAGRRHRHDVRHAHGHLGRRAVIRVRPGGRDDRDAARSLVGGVHAPARRRAFTTAAPSPSRTSGGRSRRCARKGHPLYRSYYAQVASAEQTGPRTVRFAFKPGDNRELPVIVGQLPVLSKAYWATRDFTKTTLEPPLGSGPYRVESLEPGRSITYRRVKDYWGAALPVNVGRYNFDTIRYDYYRDDTVALEAFKGGRLRFPAGGVVQELGDRLRRAGGARRPHPQGADSQRGADRHAGLRVQHAPRDLPRSARARGAGRRLRLRVEQRAPVLRRLRAHRRATSPTPSWPRAGCPGRPSWRCWSRFAAGFPTRCSRASTSRPRRRRAGCGPTSCARSRS